MRYVRRSLKLVLAVGALSVLTACLGVDVNTRFNEDGSGSMTTKLQISQMFLQMAKEGDAPVPLTKEDFEAAYTGLEGVSVQSVAQENTDQDRIITSVVSFKDYSVFGSAKGLAGAGATLSKEDGRTVYRVAIGESKKAAPTPSTASGVAQTGESAVTSAAADDEAPPANAADQEATDQAMQAMLKSFVAGYSVSYTVTAPKPVVSHTVGELSADGTSVHYTITMSDYMDLKQPVMFEVKW